MPNSEQIASKVPTSVYVGSAFVFTTLGALIGWSIYSFAGLFVGMVVGACGGVILSEPVFEINGRQVKKLLKGSLIGAVLWGIGAFIGNESDLSLIAVFLLYGVLWGAVVFVDIKAVLILGLRGAVFGLVASIPIGVIVALTSGHSGEMQWSEWLTVARQC